MVDAPRYALFIWIYFNSWLGTSFQSHPFNSSWTGRCRDYCRSNSAKCVHLIYSALTSSLTPQLSLDFSEICSKQTRNYHWSFEWWLGALILLVYSTYTDPVVHFSAPSAWSRLRFVSNCFSSFAFTTDFNTTFSSNSLLTQLELCPMKAKLSS